MQKNDLETDFAADEYIERPELMCPAEDSLMSAKSEWEVIDCLVLKYQGNYPDPIYSEDGTEITDPAGELLNRFQPLFKKYITLIKTGQINFKNTEQRLFVALFNNDEKLKRALYNGGRTPIDKSSRAEISRRFNFVKETFGNLEEEEILTELYIVLLTMAKRYKRAKRSFCCYVYNSIRYEVFRLVQKYTRNIANIHYRNISLEKCVEENNWEFADESIANFDELIENDGTGIPNFSWIQGLNCSEVFQILSPLERKILSKYYLEHFNDKQIADEFKLHINTCNTKRHQAVEKLAAFMGYGKKDIKRSRNSGRRQ